MRIVWCLGPLFLSTGHSHENDLLMPSEHVDFHVSGMCQLINENFLNAH